MLISNNQIKSNFSNFSNKNSKLSREVKNNKYFKIVNGLYETNKKTPGYVLAGAIYGPSYLSFDYALGYYDLIPERVVNYTSATFGKKKKKKYENDFGTFFYRDVPEKVFSYGVKIIKEGKYYYQIATPEKALCDKLYTLSPVKNIKEMEELLTENLRIDIEDLIELNMEDIKELANLYHCTNVRFLYKYLRRLINEQRYKTDVGKL